MPELKHTFLRGIGKKGGLLDLHRWPVKAVRAATLATGERGWGGRVARGGGERQPVREDESAKRQSTAAGGVWGMNVSLWNICC